MFLTPPTHPVILSKDCSLRPRRKEQPQSKDLVLARSCRSFALSFVRSSKKAFSPSRFLPAALLCLAASLSPAQSSLTQILQPSTPAPTSTAPADPLNRNTPSGSVLGFLQA